MLRLEIIICGFLKGMKMADTISQEKRSWNMSRIRSKDTAAEVKVRKYLFSQGFRYRKNVVELPGKPDIVLPKYKTVIFVHGCFWHQHEGCRRATTPKTRQEYWLPKFERNVMNDKNHAEKLAAAGWKVIVLWECEITSNFQEIMDKVIVDINENEEASLK